MLSNDLNDFRTLSEIFQRGFIERFINVFYPSRDVIYMKEARRWRRCFHLGHLLQLRIILSSLTEKTIIANARCTGLSSEKIHFLRMKRNRYDFQKQQNGKLARQSHFTSASFDTPFRGEFSAFIYPLANKIVKKGSELLRGYSDIKCALIKLK